MCYKPYMRKWMRERLKRRGKDSEKAPSSDAKPAPLQPDFYGEAPATKHAAPAQEPKPEPQESPELEGATQETGKGQALPPEQVSAPGPSGDGPSRRRRRRGRGGRGRGSAQRTGRSPQSATASQPALAIIEAPEATTAQPLAEPAPMPKTPATTPITSKATRGVVVLAIGLPGSGKSSWFKRHNVTPLSSDMVRSLLFDDPQEQRFQDLVFSNLRSMLKARLIARRPMNYLDATNLTSHERHNWIKLAKDFNYDVQAVFFDVPVDVCMERNQRRQRVVPEDVMRRMASKLRPPTFEEGFSKITVVRVKKKE